jgi:hypothetical protein
MEYKEKNNPNNPDSTPLYNDSVFKFWNWFDTVWNCNDWMTWHKSMTKKYGTSVANRNFMTHWNNLANFSSAIDCRTFNTAFRDYFRKVGILNNLYSGTDIIIKPIGAASDVVTNVSTGISQGSKVFKIAIPLIMILVIVYLIIYFYKKSK